MIERETISRETMKTLILCPLRAELNLIAESLGKKGLSRVEEEGRMPLFSYPDLHLKMAVGGHGKVQFALHTQFLLQQDPTIERVICMGCAGALAPEVGIGDVVLGKHTLEHDFLLKFILKPSPLFKGHAETLERLLKLKNDGMNLHVGTIASGDEDVLEEERAHELYRRTQALAVAWEGAGGARACAFHNVPYLEVRGVTDRADERAVEGFESSFRGVMERLSDCVIALG